MQSSLGHQSWRPVERVRYAELNAKYDRFLTKRSLSFSVLDFDRLRIIMDGAYFLFCGAPQKRKGIDGLAELCRERLSADPFSGCLFVFRGRRATAIKLLQYDGQGFILAQKRLSKGRFVWWPSGNEPARSLEAYQAQLLVVAGNPDTQAAPMWHRVS